VKRIEDSRENGLYADLIIAASILRARNFLVPETPSYKIKMVAGKFSPALITTATSITGALSFETFNFFLVSQNLSKFIYLLIIDQ